MSDRDSLQSDAFDARCGEDQPVELARCAICFAAFGHLAGCSEGRTHEIYERERRIGEALGEIEARSGYEEAALSGAGRIRSIAKAEGR